MCACPLISPFFLQTQTPLHPLVLVLKSCLLIHCLSTKSDSLSRIVICCWIGSLVPGCSACNCPPSDSDPCWGVINRSICIGATDLFTNCTRESLFPPWRGHWFLFLIFYFGWCAGRRWGTGQQWKWWDFWSTSSAFLLHKFLFVFCNRQRCVMCVLWRSIQWWLIGFF